MIELTEEDAGLLRAILKALLGGGPHSSADTKRIAKSMLRKLDQ